ncbi:hypothetical protein [Sphingomonas sp. PP-CC-3A-396]|uniref:hypothetical protein n=1 Tax=Sphingomonas sp. PP-CC-3A-396 TaxID=2135655 RepID=UPI001043DA22|nr:hypothetical protein [Sphingomonas sp. PP-CC-3A-396]TCQ04092.1 hypothetical protein C8J40_109227 [Sphingomonas sp. PP-CC-3A-396]
MRATNAKAQKAQLFAEGVLASHVAKNPGPFNIETLARSYALPAERVAQIVKRNGGSHAE